MSESLDRYVHGSMAYLTGIGGTASTPSTDSGRKFVSWEQIYVLYSGESCITFFRKGCCSPPLPPNWAQPRTLVHGKERRVRALLRLVKQCCGIPLVIDSIVLPCFTEFISLTKAKKSISHNFAFQ